MSEKAIHDESEIHANCVFCKIIHDKIAAVKVYEDDDTLAFMDISPSTPGHTLVVPKHHFENIYTLPAEDLCRLMITTQKITLAIKNSLQVDGVNIVMNNEAAAGQIIWHAHLHVIPRVNEDGQIFGKVFEKHQTYVAGEMEEIAEKIKKGL